MSMGKKVQLAQIVEYATGIGWVYDEGRNMLMAPEGDVSVEMIAQMMASGTDIEQAFQKVINQMDGNKKIPSSKQNHIVCKPPFPPESKKEIPPGKTRILLESCDGKMDLMLDIPLQQVIVNILSMDKK